MFVFQSMNHVFAFTTITAMIMLVWVLRKNPLMVGVDFIKHMFTSRKYMLHFIGMIAILYLNKLELLLEAHYQFAKDLTSKVYALEGNLVYHFQSFFEHEALTAILAYVYIIVFPAILVSSIGIYTTTRHYALYYALCYAVMLNYLIAIPFYLFVPVNEVWAFEPIGVRFLMLDVFPSFEDSYRNLSGLDNCFPSLHTSLSVTLAIIAWHHPSRLWKGIATLSAVTVIFSIFYLGIHWVTDMAGGLILGTFAAFTGLRLAKYRDSQPSLVPSVRRMKREQSVHERSV
ncbi:phosphatase PAP2 family protein [Marinicrinis sediminis]|uniref:Phosphatase PAP2 family protein n=1 Tax=Marinicrinis sediminis TaxID=1652465 RepID=A0ABW5R7Q7_9BACL